MCVLRYWEARTFPVHMKDNVQSLKVHTNHASTAYASLVNKKQTIMVINGTQTMKFNYVITYY